MVSGKIWYQWLFLAGTITYGAQPVFGQTAMIFDQLMQTSKAEMTRKGGKLVVGTQWTGGEAKPVLEAFRKDFPFVSDVSFDRVSKVETVQRMLMEYKAGRPPAHDITTIAAEVWTEYEKEGIFVKPQFSYTELLNSPPQGWSRPDARIIDPKGYYISVTGSVRGIVYNTNLVSAEKAPKRWEDCLDPLWKGKVLYDPRPKLTALQHDPKTREAHLKWLKGLIENKVVLNRGLAENLEKVVAGEFPLNCGVNYHQAIPMIDDKAPIAFVFPDPLVLELTTQIHVLKWSKTPATTQLWAIWLATKGQPAVEKFTHRGFPWEPESRKYPMTKGKYVAVCDPNCLAKEDEYNREHHKILNLPGAR